LKGPITSRSAGRSQWALYLSLPKYTLTHFEKKLKKVGNEDLYRSDKFLFHSRETRSEWQAAIWSFRIEDKMEFLPISFPAAPEKGEICGSSSLCPPDPPINVSSRLDVAYGHFSDRSVLRAASSPHCGQSATPVAEAEEGISGDHLVSGICADNVPDPTSGREKWKPDARSLASHLALTRPEWDGTARAPAQ